jgi:hypothetical protein
MRRNALMLCHGKPTHCAVELLGQPGCGLLVLLGALVDGVEQ